MKRKIGWSVLCVAVLLAGLGLALSSCEEANNVNGLSVSPSSVVMTNDTQLFTAQIGGVLGLPLSWRVTNPALGDIISSSGSNAIYSRTSEAGVNQVIVRDQYEAEGFATVSQP